MNERRLQSEDNACLGLDEIAESTYMNLYNSRDKDAS